MAEAILRLSQALDRAKPKPTTNYTNPYATDGHCHNAEPGTYGHECGRPASWLGITRSGFAAGFCDRCRQHGYEAKAVIEVEEGLGKGHAQRARMRVDPHAGSNLKPLEMSKPMAEATQRLHQAQVRASMSLATNTLALQRAMKAAKHQLSGQGLRPSQFSHRELVIRAEAYLADHREELIEEARAIVARWQAEGFFGRARLRNNDHPKAR